MKNKKTYFCVLLFSIIPFLSYSQEHSLHFISNSHLDSQWNWDVATTIDEYIPNTLRQNIALLDKYPQFQFNFEAAIHYQWMKEYYPDEYENLKTYIRDGRWHPSGASINANDVMVPSAESIIRNFLYGQTFYKEEFNKKGGNDIMLPDCFGFPYSLPTLAKHCGITGFHTAKLAWGSAYSYNDLAPFGIWKGVDGSEIYAIFKGEPYDEHEAYNKDMSRDAGMINLANTNLQKYGVPFVFRYVGPRSDRGGALKDNAGESGENTPYWLQTSVNSDGPLNVHLSTPDDIFSLLDQYRNDKYFVWDNELPMSTHGVGCYTSQAMMKYWNRKNELLADATEKASVFADWIKAADYPEAQIREFWTKLLWHQFHDDLTGTSIPNAYTYSRNDEVLVNLGLAEVMRNSIGAVVRKMDTQVEGIPLVVYNPLSIQRTDIVEASVAVDNVVNNIRVFDKDGNEVLSQILNYDAKSRILSFLFEAEVSSLGYATYDVRLNEASTMQSGLSVTNEKIENDIFVVTLDGNGDVSSVYDKKLEMDLLTSPIRLAIQNNRSTGFPSWEIMWNNVNSTPRYYVDEQVEVSIQENGPLRVSLKVTRSKAGSDFIQYIRLMPSNISGRIDFVNEVNWRTQGGLLKAEFPLKSTNTKATYDLSIGAIERGINSSNLYEVAGHQWANQTHTSGLYGVSILNDCKYGWDKPNNNMLRLTLLHTPTVGGSYAYQKDQDLGYNKFTYSFYPHTGTWNESTQWEASRLNQPFVALQAPKHSGSLGKSVDFVSLNTNQVAIKALKKMEGSDEIVVRVYELVGENHDNVSISFPANIIAAREINGIEEEVGTADFSGKVLSFSINKFQPKSFAVKLADADTEILSQTPESECLELAYNVDVMSYDSRKNNATSGTRYAYPAELLSDILFSDGIAFKIGGRENGNRNAVLCLEQEITLPPMANVKKMYILAASNKEEGTVANFILDGVPHSFDVPYYAGNVGEWETEYNLGTKYRRDNVAFTATHRHNVSGNRNESYKFMYMYKYCIPVTESSSQLILPNNPNLYVFAITLSDNENDDVVFASEVTSLLEATAFSQEESGCSKRLIPTTIRASHNNGTAENGDKAADMDLLTKWCVTNNSTPYLEYVFDEPKEICRWFVMNAGAEDYNYVTKAFKLQRYEEGNWIDVDVVTDNRENKINHFITPFSAQRVRLQIIQGEQNGNTTRIFEFAVYGNDETVSSIETLKVQSSDACIVGNYPNPVLNTTTIYCETKLRASKVQLEVYDFLGNLIERKESVPTSLNGRYEFNWDNSNVNDGIYLYKVWVYDAERLVATGINKLVVKR